MQSITSISCLYRLEKFLYIAFQTLIFLSTAQKVIENQNYLINTPPSHIDPVGFFQPVGVKINNTLFCIEDLFISSSSAGTKFGV